MTDAMLAPAGLPQLRPEVCAAKEDVLRTLLRTFGRVAVAYSGGVDSAYLADMAHEVLGLNAHIVLADSPSIPRSEVEAAESLALARGWNFIRIETTEFEQEAFLKNDGTRCYHCKSELFGQMERYAADKDIRVLAYGEIVEDRLDPTRQGARAAREHRVVAPLSEAGLLKDEIRELSLGRGLPTWNKASFACLSSRFPRGTRVNIDEMQKVESAEELLKSLGFSQYRARHHGELCRIEVDTSDFDKVFEPRIRERLVEELQRIGYRHVTLDLAGYRTGSTA